MRYSIVTIPSPLQWQSYSCNSSYNYRSSLCSISSYTRRHPRTQKSMKQRTSRPTIRKYYPIFRLFTSFTYSPHISKRKFKRPPAISAQNTHFPSFFSHLSCLCCSLLLLLLLCRDACFEPRWMECACFRGLVSHYFPYFRCYEAAHYSPQGTHPPFDPCTSFLI